MNAPLLNHAAAVTAKLLLFRAGPQDFPHAPQLVVPLPLAAIAASALLFSVAMPGAASLVLAALNVAALALVTHWLLNVRRVGNRFQQTYHSLLATGIVLTLALIPPMVVLAPIYKQVAANPDLLKQPNGVEAPILPLLLFYLVNIWNFAVYVHVFRNATDSRVWGGALIALVVVMSVMMLSTLAAQLVQPLL